MHRPLSNFLRFNAAHGTIRKMNRGRIISSSDSKGSSRNEQKRIVCASAASAAGLIIAYLDLNLIRIPPLLFNKRRGDLAAGH